MTLEEGFNNKTIFMEWWNREVIKTEPETCSDSFVILSRDFGYTEL
jgi:hypothetical protein